MSPDRPKLLVAATNQDAMLIRQEFPQFSSWQVMTPRNKVVNGWMYGEYTWSPDALELPARTRWALRTRLKESIDEHSEEKAFPEVAFNW